MFKCFDKSRKVMERKTVFTPVQETTPVKVEIVEKQETIQEESVIVEEPVIETPVADPIIEPATEETNE
jgi:hypothetical protein